MKPWSKFSGVNSSTTIVASLGLIGAPFAGAYFSKESIAENIITDSLGVFFAYFIVCGVIITLVYRIRFLYLVVLKWPLQEVNLFYHENIWVIFSSRILFIPAFSSGLFLTSLFVEYPFGILDTVYFKSLILLSLILTFFIINLWSLFSEFHFIEWEIDQNYSWIRICIMPYFRSRFFKSKLFIMSFSSSIIGEAFFITLSREIKSTKLNFLRVYKFESSVFFQLISLVPLSLIIFRIIK